MLDRYMEERTKATEGEIDELRETFKSRLRLAYEIFGDRAFRYEDENGNLEPSQTLYDGVMVALDKLWEIRVQLSARAEKIARDVDKLLKKRSAFEVIVGRPNTAKAVRKRMDLLAKAIKG